MSKGPITKTFEFQVKELEAGILRCQENIRVFESEVRKQQQELPILKHQLHELMANPSNSASDEPGLKRKIAALKDNIARCEKNLEIYSQEVKKQQKLRLELQIELQRLKIEHAQQND